MCRILLRFAGVGVMACVLLVVVLSFIKPSNERTWDTEQQTIAHATIAADVVTLHNVRAFTYPAGQPTIMKYEDRQINIHDITGVDFVVSYFSESDDIAHTFVTFTMKDQPGISISIEARREQGEKYSPFKGIFRKYELIYVVGDERDIIGLRTHVRNERLYLYPTIASAQTAQNIFMAMVERLNELYTTPAFYNTVFDNCTNVLVRHIESASNATVPLSLSVLLPGHADALAYSLGLLKTNVPFDVLKSASKVDPSTVDISDPLFSQAIRSTAR